MIDYNPEYESDIQSDIVQSVKSWGWIYIKNKPGVGSCPKGWPDLSVYGPHGVTVHVETKRLTGSEAPMQSHWRNVLRKLGHSVYTIRNHGHAVRVLRREHERAREERARGSDQRRT
jgi:hypothetical protein